MKAFIACLSTETNSFSPIPTGFSNFAETFLVRGGEYGEKPITFAMPLLLFRRLANERGWSTVESLCAFAQPAGFTVRSVYEAFRDEILDDLQRAMPVDMVLLGLHGAMIADGYDDCEGDLIAAVRRIVGPGVPIGAELDPHCHLTQTMVANATALVCYKEYPHTDIVERAEELFHLIADAAMGETRPRMSVFDCRMIGVYHTTREPMKSYVAHLKELEGRDGVLSISVAHCFPWGDIPEMGTRVLVITDDRPDEGAALAEALGRNLFDLRHQLWPDYVNIEAGLDRAVAVEGSPVVIADVSDNAGGGAPGDSTFILKAMLDRGIEAAAVACIWDPIAVSIAMDAGEGAHLDLRLGGKLGPSSGDPLDLAVTVTKVAHDVTQAFGQGAGRAEVRLGNAVAVRANGIDIVLNTIRTQTFSPDCFTKLGIDPQQRRLLVVKSSQHFYAAFAPIAAEVLYVAAPGAIIPNLTEIPYRRIDRNKWPFVENPFAA
ncbi:MAG TPA: microcystin LR degradation protein MlrC-like protein [Chloroflexi bacterium]|nr:microcystin LR degradation protein MlrC-like protein [Chloroflexota bacterium]